jgi:DNA-binding MarR family transcriptional regulator
VHVGAPTKVPVHPRECRRMTTTPTDEDYRRLLELRTGLRRFLRWSERQAKAAGLTAAQHQLLLAVRGHADPRGPTVGDVADYLLLRHHSAVGLIDRAEAAGLLRRSQDPGNSSAVRIHLTEKGSRRLEALSELHLEELAHLGPTMHALWDALERADNVDPGRAPHPAARARAGRFQPADPAVAPAPTTGEAPQSSG